MIYWIEDTLDGSVRANAESYEEALEIQHILYTEFNVDTYIK